MWNDVLDVVVKVATPVLLAFGVVLAKKAFRVFSKKINVEISAQEWEIIDRAVEEAVRSVEEDSNMSKLSSVEKEELALQRIRNSCKEHLGNPCKESVLRIKVRASVNRMYNHDKLKSIVTKDSSSLS